MTSPRAHSGLDLNLDAQCEMSNAQLVDVREGVAHIPLRGSGRMEVWEYGSLGGGSWSRSAFVPIPIPIPVPVQQSKRKHRGRGVELSVSLCGNSVVFAHVACAGTCTLEPRSTSHSLARRLQLHDDMHRWLLPISDGPVSMRMTTSALMLVVLSQTVVAAQPAQSLATPAAVVQLEVARATPDERRIRRLQRRRLGLLYGSAAPLVAGIVLSIRGYVLAPDDDDYVATDTGFRRAEFSPVRSVLGGIGIAAGIFMLGRSRRVGRHARQLEHPPSLGEQRLRHERRFRRLTGIGGAFLLVGVGTGIVAAAVGDDCDDDGFLCIPTGVLLAVPAVAFALGGLLIGRGMTNRKRGRAIQSVQVGLGAGSAELRLEF